MESIPDKEILTKLGYFGWKDTTGRGHKWLYSTQCQQKRETSFRTMKAWPCLYSLLYLCHFCVGGKPSCVLGGHRHLGKESTEWVLLMRTLNNSQCLWQQAEPLTGGTLNKTKVPGCVPMGKALLGLGQAHHIPELHLDFLHYALTILPPGFKLCSFYKPWKCFSRAMVSKCNTLAPG